PAGSSPPSCSGPEDPTGCGVITTRKSDTKSEANQPRGELLAAARHPDKLGDLRVVLILERAKTQQPDRVDRVHHRLDQHEPPIPQRHSPLLPHPTPAHQPRLIQA